MLPSNHYYNSSRNNEYGGRVFPGCGYVAIMFNEDYQAIYNGEETTAIGLLKKFSDNKNCQINRYQWIYIDELIDICKAIDAKNGTKLQEYVEHLFNYNLPAIRSIEIDAKVTTQSDINVGEASSDDNDETYPTHVILPVMIYVGQSRRQLDDE